ncbi:hypothetical protein EB061_05210 [bacterium]|nr:hypothetical protein [bacterium]
MSSSIFDSESDFSSWLKKDRLEQTLEPEPVSAAAPETSPFSRPVDNNAPIFQLFEKFLHFLVEDQLKRPEELLKLNPSRRENLGRFLAELSNLPPAQDAQEALRQFVRADRTAQQHEALKQLCMQIAMVQVAKALLIFSWRKHSGTVMNRADLRDLTAAVERDLRPWINLQTSSCQLIQRNFYSWYKLTPEAQNTLWGLLENIKDLEAIRKWLFLRARKMSAETLGERQRYGDVFYKSLWRSIERHRLLQQKGEQMIGFSPTLRDGSLFEHAPASIDWIGFEPLSFELLFGEVRFFWRSPKCPPLWSKGNALEMSMEQQSSLLLTHCGKQNILKQMDSISCAEVGLIAEESIIRSIGKSLASQALRELVDEHAVLKKIKQPYTSRGMYQACQTLEKLRQNGILIWAREELLTEESGKPALYFLLNQAQIIAIADLGSLVSASDSTRQDIPKALYLLRKENRLEERKGHRPLLIKAYGTVRDETDVETLFDRIMGLVTNPEQVFPPEPFHLQARVSPMEQREWEQHWFNPNDDEMVDQIEELKRSSIPLGQFATIRTFNPSIHFSYDRQQEPHLFSDGEIRPDQGFYVWVESSRNGNEIFTATEEKLPGYLRNNHALFYIAPLRAAWSHPLQALMRSSLTRDWFNYSVERKKGAWLIKESDLKAIPLPTHIADALTTGSCQSAHPTPQDQRVLNLVSNEPHNALKAIESHPQLRASAFIFASQILLQMEEHQGSLFSLITPDEQLRYPEFFQSVLTENDLAPIHQHPLIRFTPTFTPHQAIQTITPVKAPVPGIVLGTAKGFTQVLHIQHPWLRDRCMEMLASLQREFSEPAWGEICSRIRLPRNPEQAQTMAAQILRAFGTEKLRRKELNHLVSVCLLSRKETAEKIGLLQ